MMCSFSRRYATFKHEKADGWSDVDVGETVSYDGDAHVSFFIWFLFTMQTHYIGEKLNKIFRVL